MSAENEGDQLERIRSKVQLAGIGKQGVEGATVELVGSIPIDCPACKCAGATGVAYNLVEKMFFGLASWRTSWVICDRCGHRFASRLDANRLSSLSPDQAALHLRRHIPLYHRKPLLLVFAALWLLLLAVIVWLGFQSSTGFSISSRNPARVVLVWLLVVVVPPVLLWQGWRAANRIGSDRPVAPTSNPKSAADMNPAPGDDPGKV